MRTLLPLALLAAFVASSTVAAESKADRDARMQWWRDARFGMFVHFGLYAIPAGEWDGKKISGGGEWILNNAHVSLVDYEKLTARFDPGKFDAKEWVRIAHDAGMRYLVVTSKHHDGFCLWPSKLTDYTVANTPFKRDLLRELADACRADGTVRFCVYYSIMDWHHPDAQAAAAPNYNPSKKPGEYTPNPNFGRYVETYLKPQLRELIENYDPGVIWFDGEWVPEYTLDMGRGVEQFCRALNPKLILNNRVANTRRGTYGLSDDPANAPGDFGTPEQEIPPTGLPGGADFESCMTLNNTWGFKRDDNKWKPAQTVVRNLVDIVSKGGNYLLNVGPTADGEIPAESVKRLADVGKWMKTSAASIHGATAGPFKKLFWGRATTGHDGTLYLHAFVWPNGSDLIVPLKNQTTSVRPLFPVQAAPGLARELDGLHITGLPATPPDPPDAFDPVIAVGVDGPVHDLTVPIRQRDDGALILLAQDCDVHATNAKLEKKGDRPYNIGYWTNVKDTITWDTTIDHAGRFTVDLEYSLGGPKPGSEISIDFGKDKSLPVKLTPGKDFLDFRTIPVGTIDLPAGPITITVRPTKKTGVAVMDLRQIRLTAE